MDQAQSQLSALGQRSATDFPESNQYLKPYVSKYAPSLFLRQNDTDTMVVIYVLQTTLLSILLVACVNVATLVFARTATRENEIVVRTALGASRRRIVKQLFVESFVLSTVAAWQPCL
jgi:ABC-type antimicrobial peptide transport system permease subunit